MEGSDLRGPAEMAQSGGPRAEPCVLTLRSWGLSEQEEMGGRGCRQAGAVSLLKPLPPAPHPLQLGISLPPSSSSFIQRLPPDSGGLLPFPVSVYEIQRKFLIPNSRFSCCRIRKRSQLTRNFKGGPDLKSLSVFRFKKDDFLVETFFI